MDPPFAMARPLSLLDGIRTWEAAAVTREAS
jgi:hypothetical protein